MWEKTHMTFYVCLTRDDGIQRHPFSWKWQHFAHLRGWLTRLCVSAPYLYPPAGTQYKQRRTVSNVSRSCGRGSLREEKQRAFTSGVFCALGCSWMWFPASCVKHLHWIYKPCLFLLGVRTWLQTPAWPVCPEPGYNLLPCWHTFTEIIYSMYQALCLNRSVLRTWERAALAIFSKCLLKFIYMFFWT